MLRNTLAVQRILWVSLGIGFFSLLPNACHGRASFGDEGEKDTRLYVVALKQPHRLPDKKWNYRIVAIDPNKDDARTELEGVYGASLSRSRDGRTFTWINDRDNGSLWIHNSDGLEQRVFELGPIGSSINHISLSPDGRELVVSQGKLQQGRDQRMYKSWRMNSDGSRCVELPIPESDCVQDWSPDGKSLLADSSKTSSYNTDPNWHVMLYDRDGKNPRRLNSGRCYSELRFSPDGRSIAYSGTSATDVRRGLGIMLADGSKPRVLFNEELLGASQLCWSPDNRSIAVGVHELKKVILANGVVGTTIGNEWIEIINANDGKRRRIDLPEQYSPGRPAW